MNELLTLNAAQIALLITTIVGVNEFLVRLRAKDLWTALTIFCAAIIGALFSLYYHVDLVGGIAAGFSAAGTLKGLSMLGNKSTPTETSLLSKSPR